MLILSRTRDQTIMIGDDTEVTIVDVRGEKVRVGINAPKSVTVHRKEVYDLIKKENLEAAQLKPEELAALSDIKPQPRLVGPPAVVREGPVFEPRVSLITLGVSDLKRSTEFYHNRLGFPLSKSSGPEVSFLRTGGIVLALYPRENLSRDTGVALNGCTGAVTLAHNVHQKLDVDAVLEIAATAGARKLKPAEDTTWGGRVGYFADPDGHIWEIAWNPQFPFAPDGSIQLP